MDSNRIREAAADRWSRRVLPSLAALVTIPALSPAFDERWERAGHLRNAVDHVRGWIVSRSIPGTRTEVIQPEGRPPLLFAEFPAARPSAENGTVLIYGHLDRQPSFDEWSDGLGPWQAVLRNGKLYGRGTVDDGYAGYAAVTAIEAVRAASGWHSRVVLLLETGEESGSPHLPTYLEQLSDRIGPVTLVLCLDSGGDDFDRLWLTDSLHGMAHVTLTVRTSDIHVVRQLLDRIENSSNGQIKLEAMHAPRTEPSVDLDFQLAPTADADAAKIAIRKALTTDVPDGATVHIEELTAENGWVAPTPEPWLDSALTGIDEVVFGNRRVRNGIGGSVPFIKLLYRLYPRAQYVVTGALGPDSNPHSSDECLDLAFAQRITEFTAHLLDAHAHAPRSDQAIEGAWLAHVPRNTDQPSVYM